MAVRKQGRGREGATPPNRRVLDEPNSIYQRKRATIGEGQSFLPYNQSAHHPLGPPEPPPEYPPEGLTGGEAGAFHQQKGREPRSAGGPPEHCMPDCLPCV